MFLIILGIPITVIGLLGWYSTIVKKAEHPRLPSTQVAIFMLPIFGLTMVAIGISTLAHP